jgi:DNA gyrase subunit A
VALDKDDAVVAAFPLGMTSHYTFLTEQGMMKQIEALTVQNAHAGGIQYFKVPEGDRVVAVLPHDASGDGIIYTAQGMALRVDLAKTPLTKSGNSGGVAGIRLKEGDRVAGICGTSGEQLLVLHELGFAKRVPLAEYPQKGRGTAGVASADPSKPGRGDGPAGAVVLSLPIPARGEVSLFTSAGKSIQLELRKIVLAHRASISKSVADLEGECATGQPLEAAE